MEPLAAGDRFRNDPQPRVAIRPAAGVKAKLPSAALTVWATAENPA